MILSATLFAALAWGFCGAMPYAATRLATALWGSEDIDLRLRKLAAAQFLIALFTGPAISAAAGPWLAVRFPGSSLPAIAVAVGMFSNALWPLLTDKRLLKPLVSHLLDRLGGWLMGVGRSMDDDLPRG